MPQAFFISLFQYHKSTSYFALPFLQEQTQCPLSFRRTKPLIFKTPGFKPCWLQKLLEFGPSYFPSQFLWEFLFSLWATLCVSLSFKLFSSCWTAELPPSPQKWPWFILLPNHVSALSSFFYVASSLLLIVEFYCQTSHWFLGYLGW